MIEIHCFNLFSATVLAFEKTPHNSISSTSHYTVCNSKYYLRMHCKTHIFILVSITLHNKNPPGQGYKCMDTVYSTFTAFGSLKLRHSSQKCEFQRRHFGYYPIALISTVLYWLVKATGLAFSFIFRIISLTYGGLHIQIMFQLIFVCYFCRTISFLQPSKIKISN